MKKIIILLLFTVATAYVYAYSGGSHTSSGLSENSGGSHTSSGFYLYAGSSHTSSGFHDTRNEQQNASMGLKQSINTNNGQAIQKPNDGHKYNNRIRTDE